VSYVEELVGKAVLKNIEDTPVKLTPVLHILKQIKIQLYFCFREKEPSVANAVHPVALHS
jgi:hypothetical protein